jgi:phosphoribosylformylglycinamidine synthase
LHRGTVIISAGANCNDITKVVEPVLQKDGGSIYYINLSNDTYKLGGSSFAQILNKIGTETPDIKNAAQFKTTFNILQQLIKTDKIQAGHDIGSGGLITTLLEMCFADRDLGASIDLSSLAEADSIKVLFAENIGIVFQADASVEEAFAQAGVAFHKIGEVSSSAKLEVKNA